MKRLGLAEHVGAFLRANGVPPAAPLVVGVSGGPDSVALLHALCQVWPRDRLTAATLNHGWRVTAAADVDFVQHLAHQWGLACQVGQVDARRLAAETRQSLEAASRQARYDFLAQTAQAVAAAHILVAHQADDQAETILMHILRGAGLTGLQGMRPAARTPGHPALTLLRPLLNVSRREVEAYVAAHDLEALQDASNADRRLRRNRVRADTLPHLATYNPQIKRRLTQLGELAAADEALLNELAAAGWAACLAESGPGWLVLRRSAWQRLPLALRRRLLRQAVQTARPSAELDFEGLERARCLAETGPTGRQTPLPGPLRLTVGYDQLLVAAPGLGWPGGGPQIISAESLPLPVPGQLQLASGWVLTARRLEGAAGRQAAAHNTDPWQAYVAWPATPLWVRPRQPGERLQPLGLGGHSTSVKEVMIDRKIPAARRARWPLVVTAGQAVWLVGHVVDERSRVLDAAQPVLHLRCYRPNPVDAPANG